VGVDDGQAVESAARELLAGVAHRGLAEIAYLLGYDEQTSFFRAFRRWHGRTPGEYRRAQAGAAQSGGAKR